MNGWEAFKILEIDVTDDKKEIKKAYARLVKKYHPEEHPKEWQMLHDAYERALKGTCGAGTMQMPFGGEHESREKKEIMEASLTELSGIDETKEERHQAKEPLSEEQEIDQMFDHIEELMQEKQGDATDEEIQKLKKLSGVTPRERVNTAKKNKQRKEFLLGIATYFVIIFAVMALYQYGGASQKEESKEKRRSSYEELQEISKEENDRWYRGLYLPTLAGCGDEGLQKAALDRSVCLQEGIYLKLPQEHVLTETDSYTVYEAEAPEQLETLVGGKIEDCQVFAFCITSNAEPECAVLWCDTEKLGFGDAVRIFYFDEEKQDYTEVIQSKEKDAAGEGTGRMEAVWKYSYGILDYRTFIIDTHAHGDGEICPHPIVLIERIQ